MKKTIKAWAMFSQEGSFYWWTVAETRTEILQKIRNNYHCSWKHYYRVGYRIRRITITVED